MKLEMIKHKNQARKFFRKHKSVFCPAFSGAKVTFTSRGFNHLFYEGPMKARPAKEAESRILLLPRALKVLRKLTFWQEERKIQHKGKIIHYWSLEAVVDGRRIKVIVRQKGTGQKCFWSVIPSWRKIDGKIVNSRSDLSKN